MNGSIIRRWLGYVMVLEGALMLLPCIVALCYGEMEGVYFLIVSAGVFVLGTLMSIKKPTSTVFYLKEGCVATALSWIVLSLFGCLPFFISGVIPNFVNALFETVSGFTTTGASILNDVEVLPKCMLFWRSFTHWIGGMGILVFIMAILPLSGSSGSNINLLRAESPGPSVGKLMPKMRQTAKALYIIYLIITVVEIVLLLCGGMPVFDALTTAFGTAGTGGFGIKNTSIAGYSTYIQWVVTIFMIMFGINFNAFYLISFGHIKKAFMMEEIRAYILIILSAIGLIMIDTVHIYSTVGQALTHTSFQVASIITTTGFSTANFDEWSSLSKTILVILMFIGACAGSTGGGIKVSRFIIVVKSYFRELNSYIHPKSVKRIKMDGKPVDKDVVRSTNVYLATFIMVFVTSLIIISFEGYDLTTNFTAIAATINNIGPGLNLVSPTGNFEHFSMLSKLVLIFDMLAGRLELFPLLVLISPRLWIENVKQENSRRRIKKAKK